MSPPTEQEINHLRTSLKRCSAETIEAAVRFRTTGDIAELPTVVYGIIERHLPAENTRSLADAPDDTRLIEDLGIDSLTLLEIVLSIEETVGISIENEELREIATLGQVKTFIAHKIATAGDPTAAAAKKVRRYTKLEVGRAPAAAAAVPLPRRRRDRRQHRAVELHHPGHGSVPGRAFQG